MVAFRFSLVYLGLFSLATQVVGGLLPGFGFRGFGVVWPLGDVTLAIARAVFGLTEPLDTNVLNGESAFFLVQTLWILVVAIVASVAWTAIDRHRGDYAVANAWFRLFVRLALAAQMFEYGITKIIPNQFEAPSLTTLLTPVGDLSLGASLWATIGASPGYQISTGIAELAAGVLLVVPRTTVAGALLCLVDMLHVFALNMTFDIGLKLTSFHLILLCLFLLAPDARRLVDFLMDRAVPPPSRVALPGAAGVLLWAQIGLGVCLVSAQVYLNVAYWNALGGGAPVSALYGIWEVEDLVVDGEARPVEDNDYDRRWRRVVFDDPREMVVQRTDDSFARYGAMLDMGSGRIALSKGGSRSWRSEFTFERPAPDRLMLEGEMDGQRIVARLRLLEMDSFRLLNSHFRWIRANPE